MKVIKYFIIALFLLNLPGIALATIGSSIGGILSYASFLLLFAYYFLYLRGKPNMWLLFIGLFYFLISGFQIYQGTDREFLIVALKYLFLVIFGNELFKQMTKKEMVYFLLIGALTILLNATFFRDAYGRYSGFYLNPNAAGFVAIIGYSLTYSLDNRRQKIIFQILFTLAGLMTFSRTFLLLWTLVNIMSVWISIKNIRVLALGLTLVIVTFTFGELFNLGGLRFQQFKSVFSSDNAIENIGQDSRTETWSMFYDEIYKYPVFGGGYGKFQGGGVHRIGPHNTFILIWGEAGIIPFLLFTSFLLLLIFSSYRLFKKDPSLLMMSVSLLLYSLTSHTYFNSYIKLCITLFIFNQILLAGNSTETKPISVQE